MSDYAHDPAPNQKAKQFIQWCAENIAEWDDNFASVARFVGSKNKLWKRNFEWRKHHNSLSYCWEVCTKSQWENAKGLSHDQ